jgi:ABC-type sulfate/molybdate transport systems ATPase subunit
LPAGVIRLDDAVVETADLFDAEFAGVIGPWWWQAEYLYSLVDTELEGDLGFQGGSCYWMNHSARSTRKHEQQQVVGDARVFVRPHDLTMDLKSDGLPALTARIDRIQSAGLLVRLELRTEAGQTRTAELSQERFGTMHLQPGSKVYVRPRHIRVFAGF